MVKITFSQTFEREFRKIRDGATKQKIRKQIQKLLENPEVGKPLRYELKGERSVYIKPYRLIYAIKQDETWGNLYTNFRRVKNLRFFHIFLLRFEHREDVYE